MPRFIIGQSVIVGSSVNPVGEMVVRKVGRKYVYASLPAFPDQRFWRRFDIASGSDAYGGRIWTVSEWEELHDKQRVRAELIALGIRIDSAAVRRFSLAKLRAIRDIANP